MRLFCFMNTSVNIEIRKNYVNMGEITFLQHLQDRQDSKKKARTKR